MHGDKLPGLSGQVAKGDTVPMESPIRSAISRIENSTMCVTSFTMRLDQVASRIAGYQQDPQTDGPSNVEAVTMGEHDSLNGVLHKLENALEIVELSINRMEQL